MAVTTVAGIAAVMPFFAVLGDPGLVERNAALHWIQSRLGVGHADFIVVLGCVFIALLVLGSVVNLAGSVAMSRFAWRVGDRLRLALFSQYLARDYLFHARHAGATLTSRVLYQSDRVTGLLQSGFVFVSNLLMIVLIVASIALVDARVAAAGLLLFGVSYLLVYAAARRRLLANGLAQTLAGAERVAVVEQALGGIKDLLVSQGQAPFAKRFAGASATISRAASNTQVLGAAPRYLLECLAGVTLILAALVLAGRSSTRPGWASSRSLRWRVIGCCPRSSRVISVSSRCAPTSMRWTRWPPISRAAHRCARRPAGQRPRNGGRASPSSSCT